MLYALERIVGTAAVIPGKKKNNFPFCPGCNFIVGSMCGYVGDLCAVGYVIPRVLQFPLPPLSLSQMSTFLNLSLT